MELVKEVYRVTDRFPKNEQYGLASQMQRAAVAIPSNIAEGYLRRHSKEYMQFLSISLSSAAELETQVLICKSATKFEGIRFEKVESLIREVMKMLYVLIERIKEGTRANKNLTPSP